ncbi:unnamed protein product [Staurois parvus]|uniref:Secreted protein n=1 Tax=Staurois parvus TaxID=386267 RepID=A0ABN9F003_9NEOB|nr:unnamed protein product [Staurois parvus]
MPLPLGAMLVTVSLAMPHGTCSSEVGMSDWRPSSCVLKQGCQTGVPPAVVKLQVPSFLCLLEPCL